MLALKLGFIIYRTLNNPIIIMHNKEKQFTLKLKNIRV